MRTSKIGYVGLLGALLASAGASAATLHECKLSDGRTVLLWENCPDSEKAAPPPQPAPANPQTAPTPPQAQGAPPANAAQKPAPTAPTAAPTGPFVPPRPGANQIDREMVAEIISGYTVCADDVEGFRPKYSAAYDFWKLRNSAMIARVGSDPRIREMIAERIAQGRAESGGTKAEKRTYCETLIGPFLLGKFAGPEGR